MAAQRIISADDPMDLHFLPPTVFADRVPATLRDRAPRVVETADGKLWTADGAVLGPSGRKAKGLIVRHDHGIQPGIPAQRLEDMDRDGISLGAGNTMWASDYPHGDSTWPDSRKAIDESTLARLPDADRRRILWDNAAKLYAIR